MASVVAQTEPEVPLRPIGEATLVIGRGEAMIVEQPTEENRHKLVVPVLDGGNGAGEAEVKITILPPR